MGSFKIVKRYFVLIVGLFIMGLGVSIITKSNLGTSPISGIPYVLSLKFPLITFGEFTFVINLLLVLAQIIILRKNFPKEQFLQVLVSAFFGFFIDFGMFICTFVNPTVYAVKIVVVLLGCIVLALGIYLEVRANVIVNPGEGLVKTIANKTGRRFGTVKIAFDCTLVIIAIIISLFAFGTLKGLREGTIISAILVGSIIKIIDMIVKHFQLEEKIRKVVYKEKQNEKFNIDDNYVVTISHQLGCGGAYIGKKLSEILFVPFVDRQILKEVADFLNIPEENIKDREERITSFWQSFKRLEAFDDPIVEINSEYFPTDKELFKLESEFIEQIAEKSSAIFLGRGGHYILRNHQRHFSIFLHADMKDRIQRVSELYNVSENESKKIIEKNDRERNTYFKSLTQLEYLNLMTYDICVNTSSTGLDNAVKIIRNCLEFKLGR
ncbi:MAG: cytidylate kinase family protein [Desulfosporosinus sp.]|nr:cytidylate kinase family protein [Desulfosporosinus sp.]